MKRGFGELELAILDILKSGGKMSVKEVQSQLSGNNKYTTVMTVMNRLAEKKVLMREKMGLHYEYMILAPQAKIPSLVQQFMQKMFGLKTVKLVSHLIDASEEDMTEEELEELGNLIDNAKKKKKHGS